MEFVPDMPIEELPIPYCAVATDWKAGSEVVFRNGSLFEAIRASISLPAFYEPVQRDGMILIDGGVTNPIPMNRVVRHDGDILVAVDVSGEDYATQWKEKQDLSERRKQQTSFSQKIINKLRPESIELNSYTMLSRASSLMIRQNSILMAQLMHPDVLVDIQMNRYGTFDYDKSEKIIAIGHQKTQQALNRHQR